MAGDGEKKNMTISRVSEEPPFHATEKKKKHWKVDSDIGVVSLVLPDDDPPPKAGDSLMGMLYPNANPQYPPKFYPSRPKGGGGGRPQKTAEEIRSIMAQTALKEASAYCIAQGLKSEYVEQYTKDFYAAMKEATGD